MAITNDDVKKIAELARLELNAEEIELYQKQLSSILDYVKMLEEVNTDSVEPTSQVTGLKNVYRDDVETSCLKKEDVLLNAPDQEETSFKVKKVIE